MEIKLLVRPFGVTQANRPIRFWITREYMDELDRTGFARQSYTYAMMLLGITHETLKQ